MVLFSTFYPIRSREKQQNALPAQGQMAVSPFILLLPFQTPLPVPR